MAEQEPTLEDVEEIRKDISDFVVDDKGIEADYIPQALAHIKRFLEDKRGILWVTVWDETGEDYFVGTDDVPRNRDKIINATSHMVVALVFKDWSVKKQDGQWWELYVSYRADAEDELRSALLDLDKDQSGTISDGETAKRSQPFMRK